MANGVVSKLSSDHEMKESRYILQQIVWGKQGSFSTDSNISRSTVMSGHLQDFMQRINEVPQLLKRYPNLDLERLG